MALTKMLGAQRSLKALYVALTKMLGAQRSLKAVHVDLTKMLGAGQMPDPVCKSISVSSTAMFTTA